MYILSADKEAVCVKFFERTVICSTKSYYLFPDKPLVFGYMSEAYFLSNVKCGTVDYAWQYVYHCLLKL